MQLALGANKWTLELQSYDLPSAILYTLAYSDIFDYPLTVDELHRYLIGMKASHAEVRSVIETGQLLAGKIISDNAYFALAGRGGIFEMRRRRAEIVASLWPLSIRYGRAISRLPFVRMVTATGALAANNVAAGADLDYLVVTKPGYVWVTRAMILALDHYAKRRGLAARICPNYLVSEDSLALAEQDLFSAQEMARMVPIAGLSVYRALRAKNSWTDSFLPNAQGSPMDPGSESKDGWPKPLVEWALTSPATRWVEKWEMRRKIAKFTRQDKLNAETRLSADFCKGHFDGHKQRTMDAFAARIGKLGQGQR
ncbi:MAG: hypothetical protein WEA61_07845 [Anaerolineales bacterium]